MNNPLATLTDRFLKERTYLRNVTPATLLWYQVAFKNYQASFARDAAPVPTKTALQDFVVAQRQRGVRPVTVNTYIGAMNAFCAWLHQEGHIAERTKLPKLRVERRILPLLDDAQMRALIGYRPTTFGQRRVHLAALLTLDTGLRISEVLHLRHADVDFKQFDSDGIREGAEGAVGALLARAAEEAVSVSAVQREEGHSERIRLCWLRWQSVGEAEQLDVASSDAPQTGTADVRLAPAPSHLRDQLPAPRR